MCCIDVEFTLITAWENPFLQNWLNRKIEMGGQQRSELGYQILAQICVWGKGMGTFLEI